MNVVKEGKFRVEARGERESEETETKISTKRDEGGEGNDERKETGGGWKEKNGRCEARTGRKKGTVMSVERGREA